MTAYDDFLRAKRAQAGSVGLPCDESEISPVLKDHQRLVVKWMVEGGRRACFAAFGLGKTMIQLEAVRLTIAKAGGMGMIVLPLGVRQEFIRDGHTLGIDARFVRSISECTDPTGIYLTNYETVRDGKLDPRAFSCVSLDEAACLRGFGGTKTFREFMAIMAGDDRRDHLNKRVKGGGVPYRYLATATPSPNEYIELLAYSAYLGVMDVGQAKTRFFKRNSEKADQLTIHPHKTEEFWHWVSSWGLFLQRPSDIGCSDEGYILPEIDVRWHEVATEHGNAGATKHGQNLLFKDIALGIVSASREKRDSLPDRIAKMLELRAESPGEHCVIWHDLEAERHAIEKARPESEAVYGAQDLDEREEIIARFSDGELSELAAKPVMLGSGCNLQRHCHRAIYLGIGFKFNDFIQSVHRLQRFLQTERVRIDLIYTEAEQEVRRTLERKWAQHKEVTERMSNIIREFGLSHGEMADRLARKMGIDRVEVKGENFTLVNEDSVREVGRMESDSVGLVLTSVPFSTQYEYSPNYADMGHTDTNEHFFQNMDYLTPELLRVLKPGRIAAIHVKDRVVPGGMTGLGFQTVYPFHARCIEHYTKHGFGYMGMVTIVTDVVRENNQTYRLGWTEQCKDATKMGVGMPEYLLIFRKPPSSNEKSYADDPVVKLKERYTRTRWQIDAHAFWRSSGNRLLKHEDMRSLPHAAIFKMFREHSLESIYDFEQHVRIGESLELTGRLPVTFMLLQPASWSPEVWTDVTRMLTLNGAQSAAGREMHLCPMQFDIADRVIERFTEKGETVLDPFGGLMTVPYRALLKGRKAVGIELSPAYFVDGAAYCKAAEMRKQMPGLFDVVELDDIQPERLEA